MSKVPYYRVPPCPKCGSMRTGRYVPKGPFDIWQKDSEIISEYLSHGQLVRLGRRGRNNAFCADCGHVWTEYINLVFISEKEYEKELADRAIDIQTPESESAVKKSTGLLQNFMCALTGHRF